VPNAVPQSLTKFKDAKHDIASLAFSPDGAVLAAGEWGVPLGETAVREVLLWQVKTGKHLATLKGHQGGINVIVFSPDGKTIVTGSFDGTVRFWDYAGKQLKSLSMRYELGDPERLNNYRVYGLALAPNGKALAAGSLDNRLLVWDLTRDDKPRVLKTEIRQVKSLAWSPDGATLAAAADDPTDDIRAEFWDAATWKRTVVLHCEKGPHDTVRHLASMVAFSPDSRTLATAGASVNLSSYPNGIHFWEANSGKYLRGGTDDLRFPVRSLAYLPDGKRVLTGRWDNELVEYFKPGEKAGTAHSSWAVASLWDAGTGKLLERFKAPIAFNRTPEAVPVAASKDGKHLAVAAGRDVYLWAVPPHQPIRLLQGHPSPLLYPLFSPDGKALAVGVEDGWRLWDLETDKVKLTVKRPNEVFVPLAFLPGDRLLTASNPYEPPGGDGLRFLRETYLRIWSIKDGKELVTLKLPHKIPPLARSLTVRELFKVSMPQGVVSHDGTRMAIVYGLPVKQGENKDDTGGVILSLTTGEVVCRLEGIPNEIAGYPVSRGPMTFTADGKKLAAGYRGLKEMMLWDAATGKKAGTWTVPTGLSLNAVANGGKAVLTGSHGSEMAEVKLLDITTGKELVDFGKGLWPQLLSADGKTLAVAGKDTVVVWDVASGKKKQTLPIPLPLWKTCQGQFSADGARLAVPKDLEEKTIQVWDVATGEPVTLLRCHTGTLGFTGEVRSRLLWSPDGQTLALIGSHGEVELFKVSR
jgi:WD40 repeat protein